MFFFSLNEKESKEAQKPSLNYPISPSKNAKQNSEHSLSNPFVKIEKSDRDTSLTFEAKEEPANKNCNLVSPLSLLLSKNKSDTANNSFLEYSKFEAFVMFCFLI